MKKLVIIPAYNEKNSIIFTVKDVLENAPDFDYVIINDCSTDNTMDICKYNGFNVLNLPINLGIGGAVQTGYLYAYNHGYDIAVQFDGDGQHDAIYLNEMAEYLVSNDLDMVIGSRFIKNQGFQSSGIRRVGIKWFTFLIKLLSGQKITDPTSGLRMCNKKTIEMFANEYPRDYPEPESTMRLLRHGRRIEEVPVKMRERQEGISSISSFGSFYYMIKVTLAVFIERMR
ncbi:MAG: glycosyltransferase family 2 protein [Lachnospiraceae bacterium]|nr:glycosyltransferase family 2 protein [Lachnospiraceae bacterium]